MWLNKKHIEEESDHTNLQEITKKIHSDHGKHIWTNRKTKNTMQQNLYRQKISNQSSYGLELSLKCLGTLNNQLKNFNK